MATQSLLPAAFDESDRKNGFDFPGASAGDSCVSAHRFTPGRERGSIGRVAAGVPESCEKMGKAVTLRPLCRRMEIGETKTISQTRRLSIFCFLFLATRFRGAGRDGKRGDRRAADDGVSWA